MISWLASYPKSGNTWMRLLLANYFAETDTPHDINTPGVTNGIASDRRLFDTFLGIQSSDLTSDETRQLRPMLYKTLIARNPAPMWMKVHDAQQRLAGAGWLIPPEVTTAAIYIVRNPLDVAVSNAFHSGHGDMARSVAKLCDSSCVIAKPSSEQLPQTLGSWSDHVASWVDQADIPVCVVRYEDMLADTPRELARVIAAARADVAIEPERLALAVRHAGFDRLATAERDAGDWANYLNNAQVAQITEQHLAMMRRFGYVD